MRLALTMAAMFASAGAALAQAPRIDDRPLVTAQGVGEVTRAPDWVRVGFSLRGEGATPVEALAAMAKQRDVALVSIRALKGMGAVEIADNGITTTEVRNPACSSAQPYLAQQRLSSGECVIVGAITTVDMDVKVRPIARVGDVASLAAQLGGKNVGLRGSGFDRETDIQAEAAQKAVADARRQADLITRAAGGRLGALLRVQDVATAAYPIIVNGMGYNGSPAPPPPPPVAQAVDRLVPLDLRPQPITRTARVTLVFALAAP